jgi:hypothetical protein
MIRTLAYYMIKQSNMLANWHIWTTGCRIQNHVLWDLMNLVRDRQSPFIGFNQHWIGLSQIWVKRCFQNFDSTLISYCKVRIFYFWFWFLVYGWLWKQQKVHVQCIYFGALQFEMHGDDFNLEHHHTRPTPEGFEIFPRCWLSSYSEARIDETFVGQT